MSEEKSLVERPSFLPTVTANEDFGTSEMNKYAKPPRLKIIQALTAKPFKPPFNDKDAIVIPQMIKVADKEVFFSFTPVYFFANWACWNPIQMKGTLPATRGTTFDPNDIIAQKARKFIKEPCPENPEYKIKYCEHLNFFLLIHGQEELKDIPVIVSFFRGEYSTGQNLIGLIQTRKAPIYACRFMGIPVDHEGKQGNWYGLDIINDNPMWVEPEEYEKYKKLYDDLKKAVSLNQVEVDYSDTDVQAETSEF